MAADDILPDAMPDTLAPPPLPEVMDALGPVPSEPPAFRFTPTLSAYQALAGFVATMLSVGGTGLTLPRMLAAAHGPRTGNMAIVVQDARAGGAITNATIEILTSDDALVTTLTSNDAGLAQRLLREGQYRVRVRHPRFAVATQAVVITKGERTVVPVHLRDVQAREDAPSASPPSLERRAPTSPRPQRPPAAAPRDDPKPSAPFDRSGPQSG